MAVNFQPLPDHLYVIPLGGLGEIGKNMMAILYGPDMVIIDAGVMFPKEDMLGIDFIIPDISFVLEHRDKVKGIFLTHGHEDHIGALPHVLPRLNVPVYGTKLTLAIVESKLREYGLHNSGERHEIKPGSRISFEKISLEFYPNVHSICDGVGIIVSTPLGKVVHSGDFKFDQTPTNGMVTDYNGLSSLGEQGVTLLLADSTYADRPGYSASEKIVRGSLERVFSQAPGRVILATFASSIPRIQQVVDAAVDYGKKICFIGKSMVENVGIAARLGYLHIPEETTISAGELDRFPPNELVVVTTGSQGEPLSALALMASKTHRSVEIVKGDTVVISATPIPGNEGLVFRTINQLFRNGAEVIYNASTRVDGNDLRVHVQGHAGQEELKLFMNLLKPKYFIPIHGEYRHLIHHARLARQVGIPSENVLIAVDGDVIDVSPEAIKLEYKLPMSNTLVHGRGLGEVTKSVVKERRVLAEDGVLVLSVVLNQETGEILGTPEILTKGFIATSEAKRFTDEIRQITVDFLGQFAGNRFPDPEVLKGNLKGELNHFFGEKMGRKPMIIPVLTWL